MKNNYPAFVIALFLILCGCNKPPKDAETNLYGFAFIFDEINHTATVTYNDSIPNSPDNILWPYLPTPTYSGDIVIPSSVKKDGVSYSVVSIGRGAFWKSSVTTVSLPKTVQSIGEYAFGYCSELSRINIPNGITTINEGAFYHCDNLVSLSLPESVKIIKKSAFGHCTSLVSLVLPNELEEIEDLLAVYMVPNVIYHGTKGFKYGDQSGFYVVSDCYPKTINGYVENGLVYNDNTKTELTACPTNTRGAVAIPDGVIKLRGHAFTDCDGITKIVLPNSLESLGGWYQFSGCTGLESIHIPAGLIHSYGGHFQGCINIKTVTVDPNNPKYDSRDNCNGIIETEKNALVAGFTTTVIPNTVKSIEMYAFMRMPMSTITIPESVTELNGSPFWYCDLKSIVCKALTPPNCIPWYSYTAFQSVNKSIPVYVPSGSEELYRQADYWKEFTNIMTLQ